jgi:hypothetical protein
MQDVIALREERAQVSYALFTLNQRFDDAGGFDNMPRKLHTQLRAKQDAREARIQEIDRELSERRG